MRDGLPTSSPYRASSNAAVPLTCGAAMLVPSMRFVSPAGIVLTIFSPGATRSGLSPELRLMPPQLL